MCYFHEDMQTSYVEGVDLPWFMELFMLKTWKLYKNLGVFVLYDKFCDDCVVK